MLFGNTASKSISNLVLYPRSGFGGKIFVLGSIRFNRESVDSRFLHFTTLKWHLTFFAIVYNIKVTYGNLEFYYHEDFHEVLLSWRFLRGYVRHYSRAAIIAHIPCISHYNGRGWHICQWGDIPSWTAPVFGPRHCMGRFAPFVLGFTQNLHL